MEGERERLRSATDLRMAIINGDSRSTKRGLASLNWSYPVSTVFKMYVKGIPFSLVQQVWEGFNVIMELNRNDYFIIHPLDIMPWGRVAFEIF